MTKYAVITGAFDVDQREGIYQQYDRDSVVKFGEKLSLLTAMSADGIRQTVAPLLLTSQAARRVMAEQKKRPRQGTPSSRAIERARSQKASHSSLSTGLTLRSPRGR
ncbi:hypothetical protein GCM10009038_36990 [Salinicola rhizosphaerae]|uniref:DUF1330 domain-containing protein n=1 Tax=Salinicola rhizosphaerae TaxID=1443141 RepID=A0ABQ3EJM7_9GAMM|nr:hypothetical protein GCM10009038_36990 [Salinicola rhizosphaerae]